MRRAISGSIALLMAGVFTSGPAFAQGSSAKGKDHFAKHCGGCHGPTGKGDGPAASALTPKPKDLTDKTYVAGLKDQYLFDFIQKGGAAVGKSPLMTPFGAKLKEAEIRDVIAYIRSVAK